MEVICLFQRAIEDKHDFKAQGIFAQGILAQGHFGSRHFGGKEEEEGFMFHYPTVTLARMY